MTLRSALFGGALLAVAPVWAPAALAQSQIPPAGPVPGWQLGDAEVDGAVGVSLDRAYALLGDRQPSEVVVAILDSGVDVTHPDIAPALWTNADELPDNGIDDDGNGYVDDVHGWSFLGGADGENVEFDTFEITRLVRLCHDGAAPAGLDCEAVEAEFEAEQSQYAQMAMFGGMLSAQIESADALLRERFPGTYDPEDPAALDVGMDAEAKEARDRLVAFAGQGLTVGSIDAILGEINSRVQYGFNLDYDPRGIVGDDYADVDQRGYGNADVAGPDPSHGTGVAGLVAAIRGNGVGIDGIAPNTTEAAPVRIMVVRTVPNGDERDKDVANAIRYAVDNGADIVNMSFGKGFSPQKVAVDAAVAYAAEHDVLLVHASGNDGEDLETNDSFPTPYALDGTRAANWLEVGASANDRDELAAVFSNYGRVRVDLFAPGVQVTSLAPGGGVQTADGTSFASPITAGVAALVLAHFPELTAVELRQLLLDSAVSYRESETTQPGSEARVRFGDLSSTGGVVNAAEAVRLAMERAGS